MFRFTILTFVTLRVTLCPLFCAASGDAARPVAFSQARSCTCVSNESRSCPNEPVPVPADCPCDSPFPCNSGCVCQVTPELNSRIVSSDLAWSLDFAPVCSNTLDFYKACASHCEEHPHRFGLESGREIRLVFTSLLL